jgi:hypothetical protein
MRARYILICILCILQLLFAMMPLIPGIKEILPHDPSSKEQLDWQIAILGFGFAILTACYGIMTLLDANDRDKFQDTLLKILPSTKIEKLRDDDFYYQFLAAAKGAQSTVNIMYLAAKPPDYTRDKERLAYYKDLLKVIRKKPDVRFNRIVRNSRANKQWISDLTDDLANHPNASICIIDDDETQNMPFAISTQIIDNKKVWFVAIQDHERRGPYRDLTVENSDVAEAMTIYYERIWKRGKVLLEAGQITAHGKQFTTAEPDV